MLLTTRIAVRTIFRVAQEPPTQAYKEAMSTLSAQAMILTSGYKNDMIDNSKLHGMTLSSATSLTIKPEPILQFNLQVPSATSSQLHKSGYLALHILKPNDESVKAARIFSMGTQYINTDTGDSKKSTTPFEHLTKDQWSYYNDLNIKTDDAQNQLAKENIHIPILTQHSERVLICQKYKVFKVHNHEIWTCTVKDIIVHIEEDERSGGLLFFNRGFHSIGKRLNEPQNY